MLGVKASDDGLASKYIGLGFTVPNIIKSTSLAFPKVQVLYVQTYSHAMYPSLDSRGSQMGTVRSMVHLKSQYRGLNH